MSVPGEGTTKLGHFPSGRIRTITRPDGSVSETAYDDAGRIKSITNAKAGNTLAAYSYRYDLNGNRIEQKETNGGSEETTGYDYDLADRLVEIREPDRTIDYQLDPVGNRTDELVVDSTGTTISHSTLGYNEREQLTDRSDPVQGLTVSQGFDADGNRTGQTINGQQRTFTYDARDRLITLAQPNAPPEVSFDYDSEGLRLRKVSGGTETRYQYDQASLLAETNAIGYTQARYHYGAGQLLSRTHDGSTPTQRHYLNDALGSPIALITQQGAISARTQYDAWGEIQKQQGTSGATVTPDRNQAVAELPVTDDQPIGFTGYLKDTDTGLYYAQARYYDPTVGRFTSEDPEAGTSMQPPSLHRYLYAYANPTVFWDRQGRASVYTSEHLIPEGTEYYAIKRSGKTKYYNADPNEWSDQIDYAGLQGMVAAHHHKKQTKAYSLFDWFYQRFVSSEGSDANVAIENEHGIYVSDKTVTSNYRCDFQNPALQGANAVRRGANIAGEVLCSINLLCGGMEAISGEDTQENELDTYERVIYALPMVGALKTQRISKFAKESRSWNEFQHLTSGLFHDRTVAGSTWKKLHNDKALLPSSRGIVRTFRQSGDRIYYRVYSGDKITGGWVTAVPPRSRAWAKEALSLPPGNDATMIQEVLIPDGTLLQRSRASRVPDWGRMHGGAEQFEIIDPIPPKNFKPGKPLK